MTATTEDTMLIGRALAYAIELYRELTDENGAPTLGIQNQIVDFILADPELREAVAQWGEAVEIDEAGTRAPKRLPYNTAYRRIRDFAESLIDQPVFMRPGQEPPIGADFGRPRHIHRKRRQAKEAAGFVSCDHFAVENGVVHPDFGRHLVGERATKSVAGDRRARRFRERGLRMTSRRSAVNLSSTPPLRIGPWLCSRTSQKANC